MKTVARAASSEAIAEAAAVIRAGGLVAFPTETVYGLGADATDARAVARIYEAKQRALNDPLIVHVARGASLAGLCEAGVVGALAPDRAPGRGRVAEALIAAFWPGPLTLVLPRGPRIPPIVSAGLDTVAVRCPDHAVAQALIAASGVPIAAPSANRFGHVSPTTARHVLDDLDGRIDRVLDGGPTRVGVESTVLDLAGGTIDILRPGAVSREQLADIVGSSLPAPNAHSARSELQSGLPAPGMLDSHYAPRARVVLCADAEEMIARHAALAVQGARAGALILAGQRAACENIQPHYVLGAGLDEVARNLYAGLRALDGAGVDVILAPRIAPAGLGEAIADRLTRAAAQRNRTP